MQIRKQNNMNSVELTATKVKRNLVIKYIIFFIVGIVSLSFFWMLLSSFGAVYQNTQIIVFDNTLISLSISLVFPFIINILPCIFRILSLNSITKKEECIYRLSQVLQIL